MKLYLIEQSENNDYDTYDYDTYDSAVVAAKNEEDARKVIPDDSGYGGTWTSPEHVTATYIGTAKPGTKAGTVICASFNAG